MKKNKTISEAQKQFMRLCEWSYVPSTLEEDDMEQDEQMPNNNMEPNANPQGGMGDNSNENIPPMGNEQPPMDNNMDPNMGDNQQDPMMGDDMGMEPEATTPDAMPPMDNDPMMDDMDMEDMGEEDDVIDVDQLTDAQEKMNSTVNSVGRDLGNVDSKISTLLSSLEKM